MPLFWSCRKLLKTPPKSTISTATPMFVIYRQMNQQTCCIFTIVHVVLLDSLLPVWSYSDLLSSVGLRDRQVWPPKHRGSRWNRVPIVSRYKYFRLGGRHLGFSTSILVGQYFKWAHLIPVPRKHRVSRWNGVAILSRSWDISTSGLAAAIFKNRLPVTSDSIFAMAPLSCWTPKMGVSRWNFVSRCNRSWDTLLYIFYEHKKYLSPV